MYSEISLYKKCKKKVFSTISNDITSLVIDNQPIFSLYIFDVFIDLVPFTSLQFRNFNAYNAVILNENKACGY